jgi:hypothetical protein
VMCQHTVSTDSDSARLCYSNKPTVDRHVEYPSRSPDFIITIATSRGLPLMPHHWNGRTGRDGILRVEPGAGASAWLTSRQADHGRRRSALLTWEHGEVASVIYTAIGKACRCTCCVRIVPLSLSYCPPLYLQRRMFQTRTFFSTLARSGSITPPRPTI